MGESKITIMNCWARSGGTMLHRCLSLLPNTLAFSEINSFYLCPTKYNTIQSQAKAWYDISISNNDFTKSIKELEQYSQAANVNIIIRDWNYASFVPLRHNNFKPSNFLNTYDSVMKVTKCKKFAFVRNAIDIWLSMNDSEQFFRDRKLKGLLSYAICIKKSGMPIFKYEDFCLNPEAEMKKICDFAQIPFSDRFLGFYNNAKTTGDLDTIHPSRGGKLKIIADLPRRQISDDNQKEIISSKADKINSLLGYS